MYKRFSKSAMKTLNVQERYSSVYFWLSIGFIDLVSFLLKTYEG